MPRLTYSTKKLSPKSLAVAVQARTICEQYARQGYSLTLRQLYYRFVANGWIANQQKEYKRLGGIVNDARMAGIIDWNHLEDRTRSIEERSKWDHPRDIILACAEQFHNDYWATAPVHVEVWVEKEALADVVQQATYPYDVTSLACRGYMSQSEQWSASQRFLRKIKQGKRIVVIHLGDHDPSGIDMSRDNEERLRTFLHHDVAREMARRDPSLLLSWSNCEAFAVDTWGVNLVPEPDDGRTHDLFEFRRIALNMDQVEQYDPPPNPAKSTDSRFEGYLAEYGDESWELDALEPTVLTDLITNNLAEFMDAEALDAAQDREQEYRRRIRLLVEEHGSMLDIHTLTGEDDMDSNWGSDS